MTPFRRNVRKQENMLIKKVGKTKTISVRVREDLLDHVVDLRAELADYGYTLQVNKICADAIEKALAQGQRELDELRRKKDRGA